jgi:serine/threonine protein kinase
VYFVEAMIGWGGSSKVYRVRHSDTKKQLAMKVVSKPKSQIGYVKARVLMCESGPTAIRSELQRTFAECGILESLDHPNIVKIYEWFQTEKKVFIFMELARDGARSLHIHSRLNRQLSSYQRVFSPIRFAH